MKTSKSYSIKVFTGLATLTFSLIAMNSYIPTALAADKFSPLVQNNSDASTTFTCIFGILVILTGLVVRFTYKLFAPSYTENISSNLTTNQISLLIDAHFPQRSGLIGKTWSRTHSKTDPSIIEITTFPLPAGCGCLIMLFTGIIFGLIGWYLMGQRDKIVINITPNENAGSQIKIDALGYRAVPASKEFIQKIQSS